MADNHYNYNYHYNYGSSNRGGRGGRRPPTVGDWLLIGFLLLVFPPVGILLLVLRLFGGDKRGQAQGRHPHDLLREGRDAANPVGARTTAGEGAPFHQKQAQGTQAHGKKISDGAGLIIPGAILSAVFGFSSLMTMMSLPLWVSGWQVLLQAVLPQLCFLGAGAGLLWAGLRKRGKARRYRRYLAMIGRREALNVTTLAGAMGLPRAAVVKDLEDMLADGILPVGFLNYERDLLVLSGEGLWDAPEPEKKAAPAEPKQSEENAVLQEIRAVNDAIDNPRLSDQIDHIGMITAKIFDYQKNNPEKSPQLHSFLSYYLPTTLKILRAYAQLEDQEVAGGNISAAMERVEGMMDKVVEGFEKQLDQLFQNDALDITSDVQVLERMLKKDGLSAGQAIRLEL